MKKLMIVNALVVALFLNDANATAYLCWDPPESNQESIIGYIIYYTRTGHEDNYSKKIDNVVKYPLNTDLNLQYGVSYDFRVAAYNSDGAGLKSNMVTYVVPPNIPLDNTPDVIISVPSGRVTITISNED